MPLDRWLWPSEKVIAGILDATGRQRVPADLDITALRTDLNQCRGDIFAKQIDTIGYRGDSQKSCGGYNQTRASTARIAEIERQWFFRLAVTCGARSWRL